MTYIQNEILEGIESLSAKVKAACKLYEEQQATIATLTQQRDEYRKALELTNADPLDYFVQLEATKVLKKYPSPDTKQL